MERTRKWWYDGKLWLVLGLLGLLVAAGVGLWFRVEQFEGVVSEDSGLVREGRLNMQGEVVEWIPIPLSYFAYSDDRSVVQFIGKVLAVKKQGEEIAVKLQLVSGAGRLVEEWATVGDMAGEKPFYLETQQGGVLSPTSDRVIGELVRGEGLKSAFEERLGRKAMVTLRVGSTETETAEGLKVVEPVKGECNRWLVNQLYANEFEEVAKCRPYISQMMFYEEK